MYASVNDTNTCSLHTTKSQMSLFFFAVFFGFIWCLVFASSSKFSNMAVMRSRWICHSTVQSGTQIRRQFYEIVNMLNSCHFKCNNNDYYVIRLQIVGINWENWFGRTSIFLYSELNENGCIRDDHSKQSQYVGDNEQNGIFCRTPGQPLTKSILLLQFNEFRFEFMNANRLSILLVIIYPVAFR